MLKKSKLLRPIRRKDNQRVEKVRLLMMICRKNLQPVEKVELLMVICRKNIIARPTENSYALYFPNPVERLISYNLAYLTLNMGF